MSVTTQERLAVVVLGMHRSGTSAMAGLLGDLGCVLPKDLMEATPMNPKGFIESDGIVSLDDELLGVLGSSWFDWTPLAMDLASGVVQGFMDHAVRSLGVAFGDSPLFVLKDPRMCRLVPFWHEVLQRTGVEPRFVLVHRAAGEVAASLDRWSGYDPGYGELLWLRYVLDAEVSTRGMPRVFASYEQLSTNWQDTAGSIARALDLTWPRPPETLSATDAFVDSKLRRSVPVREGQVATSLVCDVLSVLDRWAAHGEDVADYDSLDSARSLMDEASPLFHRVVQRGRHCDVRLRRLLAERVDDGADFSGGFETRPDGADRVQALSLEVRALAAALDESRTYRNDTEAQVERMRLELERAVSQRDQLKRLCAAELSIALRKSLGGPSIAERTAQQGALLRQRQRQREERLRGRLASLEAETAALLASRSWRITAPLRKLSEWLGRGRLVLRRTRGPRLESSSARTEG